MSTENSNVTPIENSLSTSEDLLIFESELQSKHDGHAKSGSANELKSPSVEEASVPTSSETNKTQTSWQKIVKTLSTVIWSVVIILILLQLAGRFAVDHIKANAEPETAVTMTVPTKVTPVLSSEVSTSLDYALASARSAASQELDVWADQMMQRVDPKFLDWYFNYFTQMGIGLKGIWINLTIPSDQEKAEKLLETFQTEFTKQVFQPELTQLQLERITRNAAKIYVTGLSRELTGLQSKYEIPQADWDRYLSGISHTVLNSEGAQQAVNLRDVARGGVYVTALPLAKVGSAFVVKKFASKTVAKAATKLAAQTGTKVAVKASAATGAGAALGLLDPVAGVGLLAWDIWDHYHTVKIERPVLKENLEQYMAELKMALLDNVEGSIMSSIYELDNGLRQQLR